MTNKEMLADVIVKSGMTKSSIAQKMGCSRPRLYKILDGGDCTVKEMIKLSEVLRLNNKQRTDIFLQK